MDNLTINVSPHIATKMDTKYMMKAVLTALIPAFIVSLYYFRMQAVYVYLACTLGCVLTEALLRKLRNKKITINDYSAILTGVLLAMVLPPKIPLWMAALAGVFAISLGKEIFGGLGRNIFNPALLARAFLMAAFPVVLTTWAKPITLDTITSATPLGLAKFEHFTTSYTSLLSGNVGGCIGETSALALILGGVYLLYTKVIDYRIPSAYIGTVFVFSSIMYFISPDQYVAPAFHVLAGGLLIGAFFMATDPVTSPVTAKGRWIFGIGCGLITMIIRLWGGLPEGVMYSILLMNAVTPLISRLSKPRRYGV